MHFANQLEMTYFHYYAYHVFDLYDALLVGNISDVLPVLLSSKQLL